MDNNKRIDDSSWSLREECVVRVVLRVVWCGICVLCCRVVCVICDMCACVVYVVRVCCVFVCEIHIYW